MELETEIIFGILILIVIAIAGGILFYFSPIIAFFIAHQAFFIILAKAVYDFLIVISFPVSLVFLIGIIISIERLKSIRKKEEELYGEPAHLAPKSGARGNAETTARWNTILAHADSTNQNDWKQAILDADSMLDDLLTKMNYPGDDLGSKLRSATKADFKTLDQAWDAHKVRNDIAHEGSAFLMSKHEATRVVNLYRQVFEEFMYI